MCPDGILNTRALLCTNGKMDYEWKHESRHRVVPHKDKQSSGRDKDNSCRGTEVEVCCVCVCGKEREGVDPVVRCLYVSATLNMHPVTSILRPQVDMDKQEYFVCLLCCISIIFHW